MKTIKQQHFKSLHSTQDHLINHLQSNPSELNFNHLFSTKQQINGKGRYGKSWLQLSESLAFSFTMRPSEVMTLSSLEVGVIISKFFLNEFDLDIKLKWPNDLYNHKGEKIGGILSNFYDKETLIVGIGINICKRDDYHLFETQAKSFDYPVGIIFFEDHFNDFSIEDQQLQRLLPYLITEFIHKNRINDGLIENEWKNYCIHLNKIVEIKNDDQIYKGIFQGITSKGEALIQLENKSIKSFCSGNLRIL